MTLRQLLETMSPDELDLWRTFHARRKDEDAAADERKEQISSVRELHKTMRPRGR